MKAARSRHALWVRLLDLARLVSTAEGRSVLCTQIARPGELHQTTPFTRADRYPELFDLTARLAPGAARILSFGCSTGEELIALRRRFPEAEIVGAEINARSRRLAERCVADDPRTQVVDHPSAEAGFDLIFALAVLQREPHKMAAIGVENLSAHYPFHRFDSAVARLVGALRDGGLLCIANAQYRIEDSAVACRLEPVAASPFMRGHLFGPDGRPLAGASARTIFRKRRAAEGSSAAKGAADAPG